MSTPAPTPSRWKRLRRQVRRGYVQLVRAPGDPRDVALGVAIGLAASLIPVAQTVLAIAIVGGLRRMTGRAVSYVAAAAATWFTNPITFGPIYMVSVGLVGRPLTERLLGLFGVAPEDGGALSGVVENVGGVLMGAVVLGPPLAAVGYELSHRLIARYRRIRAERRSLRAARLLAAAATSDAPGA